MCIANTFSEKIIYVLNKQQTNFLPEIDPVNGTRLDKSPIFISLSIIIKLAEQISAVKFLI